MANTTAGMSSGIGSWKNDINPTPGDFNLSSLTQPQQSGFDPSTGIYRYAPGETPSPNGPGGAGAGSTAPNQFGPNTYDAATNTYHEATAPSAGGAAGSGSMAGLIAASSAGSGTGAGAPAGGGAGPAGATVVDPASNSGSPAMQGLQDAGAPDAGGGNMLDGPSHFRTGIGNRIVSNQNSPLAGLRKAY